MHYGKDHAYPSVRPKRKRDSLEVFFFLGSGFYLLTMALPLFSKPHFDSMGQYASRGFSTRRVRKRSRERYVYGHINDHLRRSQISGAPRRRVVYLQDASLQVASYTVWDMNLLLASTQDDGTVGKNEDTSMKLTIDDDDNSCVPMAKWQSMAFPTCNTFHETNTFASSRVLSYYGGRFKSNNLQFYPYMQQHISANTTDQFEERVLDLYTAKLLSNGWFRNAWRVTNPYQNVEVAVKTLRIDREFLPEYYELHRRDAVAMERLTASPYVMDIYGHCGNSAMTELAFREKGIDSLYRLATGLKDNFTPHVLQTKLQIAAMVAMGLSHVHNVPTDADSDSIRSITKNHYAQATIAHYDFNPRNIIISSTGTPKINDFNCAEFLSWDAKSHESCGFGARFHEPWWRAPEEMIQFNDTNKTSTAADDGTRRVDEKTDVYSLGNTLFVLLTGLEPRGKKHKQFRYDNVSKAVADGEMPAFPKAFAESKILAVTALRDAITKCWEPDPRLRPKSAKIAQLLYNALKELKEQPSR